MIRIKEIVDRQEGKYFRNSFYSCRNQTQVHRLEVYFIAHGRLYLSSIGSEIVLDVSDWGPSGYLLPGAQE